MTRSTVHNAIDFQGVIEGCPDHQWLLTDALYDTAKEPPSESTPRWVVLSHHTDSPPSSAEDTGYQNHYEARDLKEGWTVSAPSATALAQQIRRHCSNPPDEWPETL